MANYKVLATWDISIQDLYKDITLIQQGISCKLNISLRSISRVTVNYKVGSEYVTDLCTIDLDNNKVIVPFKKNVLEVGANKLELVCHMKNGDVLVSPTYIYDVIKSLDNTNDITEEDAYPVLIGMIQELTEKENVIQANEEARANAEMHRELNEDERSNAEVERKANENIRISNENIRQSNESSRQQYESQRRVEEDERLTDEQVRVNAENIRIANENERLRKEIERQNAEELRQIAYNSSLYGRMDEVEDRLNEVDSQLAYIMYNAIDFGITGVGDETQLLQDFLNMVADNNGVAYLPSNITVNIRAIYVENKANFRIKFDGIVKRLDNVTASSLINLSNVKNLIIENIIFDGNSTNNGCVEDVPYTSNEEQKHCMIIKQCENIKIFNIEIYNPCGDGVYISNNSSDIYINRIYGYSELKLGRNLLSLTSCSDIHIDNFICKNIGHFDMPGGLDIEPNNPDEAVKNVYISNCHIESEGTNPLSIMATNNSSCENVHISNVYIKKTIAQGNACCIISASDVFINAIYIDSNNVTGIEIRKHSVTSSNINISKATVINPVTALRIYECENFNINLLAINCSRDGVELIKAKNGKISLDVDSVGSDRFPIYKSKIKDDDIIENIIFTGDISKRGTGLKAFRCAGTDGDIINCKLINLDFTGWKEGNRVYGASATSGLSKYNCNNLTSNTRFLSREDTWCLGDYICNINPIINENNEIVKGWICVQGGQYGTWKEDKIIVS